jgi:small subunit ribosomal protein S1
MEEELKDAGKDLAAETPAAEEAAAEEAAAETSTETPTAKETAVETPATPAAEAPVEETAEATAEEAPATVAESAATAASVEETAAPEEGVAPAEETIEAAAPGEAAVPQADHKKDDEPAQMDPDFDWDAYEKGDMLGDISTREKLVDAYDKTLNTVKEKEVIIGKVIGMNKREVVVNIGFKSDGIISLNEFRYNPDLKIGDEVEVYIESQEDKKGQLVLSHKKARAARSWDNVNAALENDEIVKGYIKCRTKGGMIVDVFGIEAFLPGSQIDVKPIRDYDVFVGKTMEFKVIKINQEFKNVVVSHKALIEAELEQQKKEIISKLEKGQVLEGTVKNITSYGVFIDLGGVDGLIHITDLSWGRVSDPREVVEPDQKVNVVIMDFNEDKRRIALGMKQLTPHPWDSLDPDLKIGDKVTGKVVVMADYGSFVEIAPGVEGLIHVSEMSWSQHLRSAQDFMSVGDEVEAVILTLSREERKMSLGIKQLKPDPWLDIENKYAVGSQHTARVRNFTNFGVFVEIEEGVDGLIHISDLSWTKKIKHPAEFTQIGANIEVVVLEIDKENRRLSLGHKQLEENPWEVFESVFMVDSVHEGIIIEMMGKGAVVSLPYGVEGFATPKHLIKEDGTQAQVDEKLPFKVIEFNKNAKRIILSHSRIHEDEAKAEARAASKMIDMVSRRKGELTKMESKNGRVHLEFLIPSRGIIGLRSLLLSLSSGEAVVAHRFKEYQPYKGEIEKRENGSMIAMETGVAVAYGMDKLQDRGRFFIHPGDEVYAGQVVGESNKEGDLVVNVNKTKKLTNVRASGSDEKVSLPPPVIFSLEEALEYIKADEYVEVTPRFMRMRKIILDENERKRQNK